MAASFKAAFAKLAILGSKREDLIDCSDVVPVPKPAVKKPASFPATTSPKDLELTCKVLKFPTLTVDRKHNIFLTLQNCKLNKFVDSRCHPDSHPSLLRRCHELHYRSVRWPRYG